MPETAYDADPGITARAIYRYIAHHGLHTAREELARWDLAPRITHNHNGSIDLTAFHDHHGAAAITYHRAVNGEISLKAASPNQRLPKWLQPARSYRPDPPRQRKPGRGDAPKLPLLHHISTDHDQFTLVLSCTNLIHILERQLALRVATAAAAVASDYLPNRAIKYAFHPRATPFSSTMPHDPMHAAKYAALNAILEAIPSEPGRLLAEKHLTEPDWFLLDLLVSTKPVRRHSLKREHISRTPEKTNRLNSVHTLPRRRPQDTGPVAAAAQLNTDLVTELLDPEATETLLALSGQPHQPRHARITQSTIPEYNTVRSSLAAYAPLAETEPGLARLYMTSRSEMSQKVPDPETLIDRLRRKNCRDNDAKWKHFRRIANIPELRNTNGYYIALAAEAAATADRDDAPDRSLIALCQCGHIIDDNKRFESRHGSKTSRDAWRRTLHAFLDPAIPTPTSVQLEMVSHAMYGHLKRNIPCEPGTWPQLMRRAAHWYHQMLAGPDLDQDADAWYATNPHPPWGKHERGHYLLTPLNSYQREDAAHHLLGFPVSASTQDINSGQILAYIATAPDRPPAAIQLSSRTRCWEVAEILAPKGRKPNSAMHLVAHELAAALRRHDPLPLRPPPEGSRHQIYPPDRFHAGPEPLYADPDPVYAEIFDKALLYSEEDLYASSTPISPLW